MAAVVVMVMVTMTVMARGDMLALTDYIHTLFGSFLFLTILMTYMT